MYVLWLKTNDADLIIAMISMVIDLYMGYFFIYFVVYPCHTYYVQRSDRLPL